MTQGGAIQDYRTGDGAAGGYFNTMVVDTNTQQGTSSSANNHEHNNTQSSIPAGIRVNGKSALESRAVGCCKKFAVVVGLLLFIGSCVAAGLTTKKVVTFDSVTGTIIRTEYCGRRRLRNACTSSNCSSGPTYRPVIQYTTVEGTYTFTSSMCSDPPPRVGNQIKVYYDPDDHSNAVNGSFVNLWLVPLILGGLGIVFMCLPCCPGTWKMGGDRGRHNQHGYHDDSHHHHESGGGGGWFGSGGDGDGGGGDGGGGGDCGDGGGE